MFENTWNGVVDWFRDRSERSRLIRSFNDAAKNSFIIGQAPTLLKSNISKGESAYKHQFSNWLKTGFRIQAFSGRQLAKDEIKLIGEVILNDNELVCFNTNLTFSLNNLCSEAQTTWEYSNNLTLVSSNYYSITVSATNQSSSGEGWIRATFDYSDQIITEFFQVGIPNDYLETGYVESQFIEVYEGSWNRLFLHDVQETSGWGWEIQYSTVSPSETTTILVYPNVIGTIFARVRRSNQCGVAPWLTEYFQVVLQGGHRVLVD